MAQLVVIEVTHASVFGCMCINHVDIFYMPIHYVITYGVSLSLCWHVGLFVEYQVERFCCVPSQHNIHSVPRLNTECDLGHLQIVCHFLVILLNGDIQFKYQLCECCCFQQSFI